MQDLKGNVFNIQRYSLHDGEGIRTVVFLKGCPLACKWCSNPESILYQTDIMYRQNKCILCRTCEKVCPENAIHFDEKRKRMQIDRKKCTRCAICVKHCPTEALKSVGEIKTVSEIIKMVKSDRAFYEHSDGGVTLSGGEILSQAPFAYEILNQCQLIGINTAIETTGNGDWRWLSKIAQAADTIFFDLKAFDNLTHKKLTTVSNSRILENLQLLDKQLLNLPENERPTLIIRIPLIEGVNTTKENIQQTAAFLKNKLFAYHHLELLPFHNFGEEKYKQLDRTYEFAHVPNMDEATYQQYLDAFQKLGIKSSVMTW